MKQNKSERCRVVQRVEATTNLIVVIEAMDHMEPYEMIKAFSIQNKIFQPNINFGNIR